MVKRQLNKAKFEAERFLQRCHELEAWMEEDVYAKSYLETWQTIAPGKKVAAVKRASMDLSEALVDIRRKRY